jgi:multimeric flavodoxin WrbA
MKILGISGSPREKNTDYMLKTVLDAAGEGHELVNLKDFDIKPCLNCKACHQSFACAQQDGMQALHAKLVEADAIVLGSPTHFDNVTGIMKNFMDRCLPFYFSRKLEGKRVVLVAVGGFKNLVDLDSDGSCVWCKQDDACARTVRRCTDSMRYFTDHLGMVVVGEVHAIHGDPAACENNLIGLGKALTAKPYNL